MWLYVIVQLQCHPRFSLHVTINYHLLGFYLQHIIPSSTAIIMSFGVGIGDILLITKIGFTLWKNLKGAQEEREDLAAKLMQWKDKLEIIKPMLADVKQEPRTVKLAREQLTEALGILENLEHLNRKFVKGKILRQAAWEVRGRATFLEYQTKLEKRLEMLDMLFLSGSMYVNLNIAQFPVTFLQRWFPGK